MTASGIAFGYMRLSFMPAVGFSVATNSLVGKYIGAGQPDIAVARTRVTLALAMAWMTACAALFVIFRTAFVGVFIHESHAEEAGAIIAIGSNLMICMAVFQTFDAIGVIYSGALRGAGDTVWPGVLTVVYSWLFIVVGGLAMIHWFPRWESTGPWIAAAVYIILFGLTMWARFAGGKWRAIRLLDGDRAVEKETVEVIPKAV
jgi:MATE family multidrug resistance protein